MDDQLILYVRYTAKPGCRESFLHDVADEGLAAAGLGRVAHVQDQLFFHVSAPPDFVAPIVAHAGGRCKFFGRGAKNVFTIRII